MTGGSTSATCCNTEHSLARTFGGQVALAINRHAVGVATRCAAKYFLRHDDMLSMSVRHFAQRLLAFARNEQWRQVMNTLDAVLDRIDQRSRPKSSSGCSRCCAFNRSRPIRHYKTQCRAAAEFVAADLTSIGFDASVRPTEGHPVVVGKASNGAAAKGATGPHVLFYGHYDVQPVDPLDLWNDAAVRAADRDAAGRPQDHRRARRLRRQRPGDDLRRGLPRLQGGDRLAAAADHDDDRGRGGVRLEKSVRFRAATMPTSSSSISRSSATPACGTRKTPAITTSLRGLVYEEVKLTCADRDLHSGLFGGAAQNPIRVLAQNSRAPCTTTTAASPSRASTTACRTCRPTSRPTSTALNLTPEQFLGPGRPEESRPARRTAC